jgi:hypothetical protein
MNYPYEQLAVLDFAERASCDYDLAMFYYPIRNIYGLWDEDINTFMSVKLRYTHKISKLAESASHTFHAAWEAKVSVGTYCFEPGKLPTVYLPPNSDRYVQYTQPETKTITWKEVPPEVLLLGARAIFLTRVADNKALIKYRRRLGYDAD